MRRATSAFLTIAIFISCIFIGSPFVYAADMTISEEGLKLLKAEEGFSKYPYWDYRQYTVGYGTKCPSDMVNHYKTYGISEEEADVLLRNYLSGMEYTLNRYIEKYGLVLTQNQYDAIALFSYNVGTGWTTQTNGTFFNAITYGATGNDLIRAFGLWCKADGEIKDFLLRRRMSEANLYINGVYSQQPPESYSYVIYNGNGGSITNSAQVFDYALPAMFICTATLAGYTFLGWYTEKDSGKKVVALDEDAKGLTLYAQWLPDGMMEYYTDTVDVSVTLIGTGVNLRTGPGAAYEVLGAVYKGDVLQITETVQTEDTLWGKSEKGWIALQFTNFAEVYAALPPEAFLPPVTEPAEPEATVPETTVPETTEPPATEPPATEPPATEPPATEPSVIQWEGKVTASTLNIRATPGGQYVGYYVRGAEVVILEKTTYNGAVWGRTDKGWISLSYVEISEQEQPTEPPATEPPATEPPATEPPATEPSVIQWEGKVTASTLNIRATPGGQYVGYYVRGAEMVILEKTTYNGAVWGRTDKGWISLSYVEISEQEQPTEPPATEPPAEDVPVNGTVSSERLNIRATANGRYLGYYVRSTRITILEKTMVASTPWGRTDKGWVCLDYVILDEITAEPVEKTVTSDILRVRRGPGTQYWVVKAVYKGAKVTILQTKSVSGVLWGRTEDGWLCMDYVK